MPIIEAREAIYQVNERDVPVRWASYDFGEEVTGIPDETVRTALLETGVSYRKETDPAILVSHVLPDDQQGLSALHEELCMSQKVADCPSVEGIVVDSIQNPQLKADFVATRLRMFGALCILNSDKADFKAAHDLLKRIKDNQ